MTGKTRAKTGEKGLGDFYRIILRPKSLFVSFRVQDVGEKGGLERVAAKRKNGNWATHAWLVSKKDAHSKGKGLVADSVGAKDLFKTFSSKPDLIKGDNYVARDTKKGGKKK